jgi:hypothetical protein
MPRKIQAAEAFWTAHPCAGWVVRVVEEDGEETLLGPAPNAWGAGEEADPEWVCGETLRWVGLEVSGEEV